MNVFSLLKKIDRALHINTIRYYLMDRKYTVKQFFAIRKLCSGTDFIMFNTPDHGNLGDQAIALSEERFFKDRFPEVVYREVTGDYYRKNRQLFRRIVNKNIVIGICGGGYIGDVWIEEEELVRSIITSFPGNKIIVFPQTVYYHNDQKGNKEWERTKQLMESHDDSLYLCLRDKKSYNFIKSSSRINNLLLYPDMVLSLSYHFSENRQGILTCFRADQEKVLKDEIINRIYLYAKDNELEIASTTTVYTRNINVLDRKKEVMDKLKEFASAKVVITERLHARIFATITGTPCIAFDNESKKISGVYEWIKDLDYIRFISSDNSMDDISEFLSQMLDMKNNNYNVDNNIWKSFEDKIRTVIQR